ncbi:MAG: hypothetical protein J6V03_06170 [Clostridia bacterium]|nr:hypothetical protein [Clostridia bacterium]
MTIICDFCKKEFSLQSVDDINFFTFPWKGKEITLHYFLCPKCNKIYKAGFSDEHSRMLASDLKVAEIRYAKAVKRNATEKQLSSLFNLVKVKRKKLAAYKQKLGNMFPGEFVFSTLQDGQMGIFYQKQ